MDKDNYHVLTTDGWISRLLCLNVAYRCSMLNVLRDGFGAYKHTILPSYKEAEYFSSQGAARHNQQI